MEHQIRWVVLTVSLAIIGIALCLALSNDTSKRIAELLDDLGNGSRGGPPTHPLPVTVPIETFRRSPTAEKPWQALIGFLRPSPPR